MKEKLKRLFTIKSIVTLCLTLLFGVMTVRGVLNGEQFLMVYTTVIAFYFGTQAKKE